MKKIVAAAVVLVALLVVAPWGIGRLAEKRIDHGLDKLVELAPYLTVVERKYTTGWFKSEQTVTFEAFAPWMQAVSDVMKKEVTPAGTGSETEAPAPAADAESESAVAAQPDAVPPVEESTEPVAPPAKPQNPLRFTIRNEILHGPVLGLSGLGIARVDSHLVLSDEVRKEIAEIFGPKDPLEISTRIGFFGGGTTTFKSEGRTIHPGKDKTEISWETFKVATSYSRNVDSFDIDGKWPKFEVRNSQENSHVTMTGMTIDGDGERARGDLYDGDFEFGVERVTVLGKNAEAFELKDLNLNEVVETKDDFTSLSIKMGSGEVKAKELTDMGLSLKEVHYDVGVRHLHTPTLAKMVADMKAIYAKPITNVTEMDKVMYAPFKEGGAELLKHDPEFVIDRIGIVTPEGNGYIKGLIKLQGATPDDFGTGAMSLIGKIDADITIDLSEKMLQKFPNGSTGAGAAVDSGYAKREGDRLICKIRFTKGQLTLNGKPQAIPGLGGPPAGAMEEAPPRQE